MRGDGVRKENNKHKAQVSRWQSKTLLGYGKGEGERRREGEPREKRFLKREGQGTGKAARELLQR